MIYRYFSITKMKKMVANWQIVKMKTEGNYFLHREYSDLYIFGRVSITNFPNFGIMKILFIISYWEM